MQNEPAPESELSEAAYDAWVHAQVAESLADPRPPLPHAEAMAWVKKRMIERRRANPDLAA